MKHVLCYGDSNTWGYQAVTGERFSEEERWTCLLQKKLGSEYYIYENGMNARTTAFSDELEPYRNGAEEIIPAIMVTEPLDLIVFMLGTNDTKHYLGVNGFTIARGMELLVQKAKSYFLSQGKEVPRILIAAPIDIAEDIEEKSTCQEFDCESVRKIRELRKWYPVIAQRNGCEYINAGEFASPNPADGIHMLASDHAALADAIGKKIQEML